jgi:hypothetical protein
MPIRNWAGLVLAAFGLWFLIAGLQRRRRAQAAWREAKARGLEIDVGTSQKFVFIGAISRPIIYLLLLAGGAEVTLAHAAVGKSGRFSVIDLGGFLFLLLCYGIWFSISTRYRDVEPVRAQAGPQ